MKQIIPTELRGARRDTIPTGTEPSPADHHARLPDLPNKPTGSAMPEIVVQDPKPVPSWKTTIAGVIAALGLVGEQLQHGWPESVADWIALLFKAFGPVLLGFFARDKNVSSEGHKVVTPEGKTA